MRVYSTPPMGYLGQQTVMGRVEVRDADTDAYIKGATVVVITSRGSITKETDIGGNAVFTLPEEVTIGAVAYLVRAPGYQEQTVPFANNKITTINLVKGETAKSKTKTNTNWFVWTLAGGAVLGLVVISAMAFSSSKPTA